MTDDHILDVRAERIAAHRSAQKEDAAIAERASASWTALPWPIKPLSCQAAI